MKRKPESAPAPNAPVPEQPATSFWRDDLPTLLVAVALALLVRSFVFHTFYVPSSSMLPTLLVGDHVVVNKFVHGTKLPFARERRWALRAPARGDVMVFRLARGGGGRIYPADQRPNLPSYHFVKRLVGLPGDTIAYENERLIMNGAPVRTEHTGLTFRDDRGRILDVLVETLGACRHLVLDDPRVHTPNMREIRIPEGRYLFMGDNRDNSLDGRRAGTVRLAEIAGPAVFNYWSWDWNGTWLALLNPITWVQNLSTKMRWTRMGRMDACLAPDEDARTLLQKVDARAFSE